MSAPAPTASSFGLASCHGCSALTPAVGHSTCDRCGAAIHLRKPDSLNRTLALVVTAALLYVPANVFPIMTVQKLGRGDPHTILGGVQALVEGGMWSLAILVFFASVLVPMLKLVVLAGLCISVARRSDARQRDRTTLYRLTEVVGRWSMIDIFMISILVALVKLGVVATIAPGPGATFFAAVVIITIFAADSFDPRLIWDTEEDSP
ncbi:MAG: paraquat-inducible protein A [Myxococcota bacterium]|nr:paraquat-inducible protein A [Myxococcota bacterium]